MKRVGVFVLMFSLLMLISFVSSAENSTDGTAAGFSCLEEKVGDCTGLTNQEIALTILSGADKVYSSCVNELEDKKDSDNFGNVLDTSLAILALNHAGKDTTDSEEWLKSKARAPSELIWYLQQDSDGETVCNIDYESGSYVVNIGEDKKISEDAGNCLKRANSNFWFEVNPSCYDTDFRISCDKDFKTSLVYKNKNSPTIYVLEGTSDSSAFGSAEVKVQSECFGESSCDYEGSLWATLALLKTGNDVENYIPYVIALSETNKEFLPNALIYSITGYEDYATQLGKEIKPGNHWLADSSKYGKIYDTALALTSVGSSSSEYVSRAKENLIFLQGSDGCWQNSIRDTAIVLWALEGKSGSKGSSTTTCSEGGFSCVPTSECATVNVNKNYYCSLTSQVCCEVEPEKKTCEEMNGEVCILPEECVGNSKEATDAKACCLGGCEEKEEPEITECEIEGGNCYASCKSATEDEVNFACSVSGDVCCVRKEVVEDGGDGLGWIVWALIIGILLLIIALAYFYRDKLKLVWFGAKSKFRKDDGRPPASFGGPGPRGPGYGSAPRGPPQRPISIPGQAPIQARPVIRRAPAPRDRAMNDTFKRLNEMSK